jgi:hypothetical protein
MFHYKISGFYALRVSDAVWPKAATTTTPAASRTCKSRRNFAVRVRLDLEG